ncbi:MAG: transcriptional repressor LexA [Wenzhouxiangella sp.]|nr:MAG: transcriptional repressor LexA [Wenzhouxiangella sp.]
MKLTRRQQEILDFIHQRVAANGLPPTRAEIVSHFGFRSPNAAQCHLKALAERGAIQLLPGRARGLVPVQRRGEQGSASSNRGRLPVIGRVTAGTPILAVENREDELLVDASAFSPQPHYILRVQGDSMIDAGIHDRDLLLVHKTPDARSGQIVVARIDDEVTVKRLRRRGRGIYLEAENPAYPLIHVQPDQDFAIEGLGVGVIRCAL